MIRVISYWHHEWPSRLETVLKEFGARGISAIGHAGIAAALTADVYHATGVRVRELPVHIGSAVSRLRRSREHRDAATRMMEQLLLLWTDFEA